MSHINGNFTVCRASAGSGKTFTLVKEYLKIALNGEDTELESKFTHILAITFTNKAANEMKRRVIDYLKEISELDETENPSKAMAKILMKEMSISLQELKRRCRIVHSSILHRYSEFAISTIDSFTHQIVQTFAHDLNLTVNFDLQLDETEIIQEAVELLLEKIGTPESDQITKVAYNFSKSRMEEDSGYDIQQRLEKIAPELFEDEAESHLKRLQSIKTEEYPQIQRQIDQKIKENSDQQQKTAQNIIKKTSSNGLTTDDFNGKSKSVLKYLETIAEGNLNANGNTNYIKDFITGKGTSHKNASLEAKATIEKLHTEIVSAIDAIATLRKQRNTLTAAKDNLYCTALLNEINNIVQTYYEENGLIHISEINKRINEVVKQEPVPFIYERIGNLYNHYLIDEFQDNSKLQWQNLVPLISNGLSCDHSSFVVGDGKQAIYRWRGGDVEQFINLPSVEGDNSITLRDHYCPQSLDTNHRTGKNIIKFNNAFFTWTANQEFHKENQSIQQLYLGDNHNDKSAVYQKYKKNGGYINIDFWEKSPSHEDTYEAIISQIQTQHNEKGYDYKDITIIARSNQILTDISQRLIQHNIPTTSVESFKLSNSISVSVIETVLKLITQPDDKLSTTKLIKELEFLYLKDYTEIIKNIPTYSTQTNPKTQQQPLATILLNEIGISFDTNKLRQLSLYDCCEEIVRIFRLYESETAYITSFLNTVNSYCMRHGTNTTQFLKWFDQKKSKTFAKISQEVDAVKMLTIHKSKGLESPIIIYPIFSERDKDENIWVDFSEGELYENSTMKTCLFSFSKIKESDMEDKVSEEIIKRQTDKLNLMYVALTRPKEKLFIHCESQHKDPSKNNTDTYFSLLYNFCEQELKTLCNTEEIPLTISPTPEHPNKINQYTLGDDSDKTKSENTDKYINIVLKDISFDNWQNRLQIAHRNKKSDKQQEKIDNGILIHEILSHIHSSEETRQAVEEYCETHHIDNPYRDSLLDSIQRLVTQPYTAHFFDKRFKSKCEAPIFYNGEELRPDRIVFKKDEILVIDFKTGYAAPGSKQMEDYRKQVKKYCQIIYEINHKPTTGYLLFLEQEQPIEVCRIP